MAKIANWFYLVGAVCFVIGTLVNILHG